MAVVSGAELAKLLRDSDLAHAEDAARFAAAAARPFELTGSVNTDELLSTQQRRHERLLAKPGAHARKLRESLEVLCARLREAGSEVGFVRVDGEPPFHYLIVLASDCSWVHGCLRVVSRLEVDEETWNELWASSDGRS